MRVLLVKGYGITLVKALIDATPGRLKAHIRPQLPRPHGKIAEAAGMTLDGEVGGVLLRVDSAILCPLPSSRITALVVPDLISGEGWRGIGHLTIFEVCFQNWLHRQVDSGLCEA